MSSWTCGGTVFRARDNREAEGRAQEEMSDDERKCMERRHKNRRLGSTIKGKNTYNKKPNMKYR